MPTTYYYSYILLVQFCHTSIRVLSRARLRVVGFLVHIMMYTSWFTVPGPGVTVGTAQVRRVSDSESESTGPGSGASRCAAAPARGRAWPGLSGGTLAGPTQSQLQLEVTGPGLDSDGLLGSIRQSSPRGRHGSS